MKTHTDISFDINMAIWTVVSYNVNSMGQKKQTTGNRVETGHDLKLHIYETPLLILVRKVGSLGSQGEAGGKDTKKDTSIFLPLSSRMTVQNIYLSLLFTQPSWIIHGGLNHSRWGLESKPAGCSSGQRVSSMVADACAQRQPDTLSTQHGWETDYKTGYPSK